jgi:hypothetical protein
MKHEALWEAHNMLKWNTVPIGVVGRAAAVILVGLIVLVTLLPAMPTPKDDGMGYSDTPYLPNSCWRVHDRRRPQPPSVAPSDTPGGAPSDAIVLFDGKDLSQWQGGNPAGIEQGSINILKTGEIQTKKTFGDCQLHVEWCTPAVADGANLNWGNSGVFFLGKHELQIIESHDSKIYADGIAGAIYGQTPPLVNASRKPGQWQTYDVVFLAPRFEGKRLAEPAYFTVFWNGILVQNRTASLGPTRHGEVAAYNSCETSGPLMLQFHHSAVRFRNIWIRPLEQPLPSRERTNLPKAR